MDRSFTPTKTLQRLLLALLLLLLTAGFALAASGGHVDSGVLLKDFLYRCLNFVLMLAILIYFVAKPFKKGMAARREGIAKALQEAETTRQQAEAKFAEYDAKLSKAAGEIEQIYAAIRQEGEQERERILANAREMAAKIQQEAEKSAATAVAKARLELRQEASMLAVALAEELLKKDFTKADHVRLVEEYMQKVGELH
jgi:F-type H+-transporting ATPase subunit b